MKTVRQLVRLFAATQLLPVLESGEETLVGGQAVLEGVMMRSPHAWGIAVRRANGELATHSEPLDRPSEKHGWMGWPIVRGCITLGHAMQLGYRAMRYSANIALAEAQDGPEEEKVEFKGWLATANTILSIAFFIAFYKFLPLITARAIQHRAHLGIMSMNLIDGGIRILLFLGFLYALSRMRDIHRVFEFHGAEHKTVFAFEDRSATAASAQDDGGRIAIEEAQRYVTWHPRCGTSFLMTVMLISLGVYTFITAHHFWLQFLIRIALLPVIAGVSYELIRFAGKLSKRRSQTDASKLFKLLTLPGLWLQRITTQPPSDDQVECAIVALDHAMQLERQRGGELVLA